MQVYTLHKVTLATNHGNMGEIIVEGYVFVAKDNIVSLKKVTDLCMNYSSRINHDAKS